MKRALILLIIILTLTGCVTKRIYIKPALPQFTIGVPARPILYELPEGTEIPEEVNINFDLMAGYAEKLEVIIDSWEAFYNELRAVYKNDDKAQE